MVSGLARVAVPSAPARLTTILCIHKTPSTLSLLKRRLEAAGHVVFVASGANAALDLFATNEIELVIADQVESSGAAADVAVFMKEIRPGVSAILLTQEEVVPAARTFNRVDGWIAQDASAPDLLETVQQVLARSNQQRKCA